MTSYFSFVGLRQKIPSELRAQCFILLEDFLMMEQNLRFENFINIQYTDVHM